jgi:hypothetical protein
VETQVQLEPARLKRRLHPHAHQGFRELRRVEDRAGLVLVLTRDEGSTVAGMQCDVEQRARFGLGELLQRRCAVVVHPEPDVGDPVVQTDVDVGCLGGRPTGEELTEQGLILRTGIACLGGRTAAVGEVLRLHFVRSTHRVWLQRDAEFIFGPLAEFEDRGFASSHAIH